ncbi:hypothetical protein AFLA_006313 [Aspergillus flavus NRRL3357]|nr:hypothetical protein AFLA_006313 [Aspergillus flavus NRRL3357]
MSSYFPRKNSHFLDHQYHHRSWVRTNWLRSLYPVKRAQHLGPPNNIRGISTLRRPLSKHRTTEKVKGGKYIWKLDELHRKYGPIVRFNPNEVHIQDSHYYHHIYAGGAKKQDKDPEFPAVPLFPGVTVTTIKHNHHRLRRGIIKSFFSKKYVTGLEYVIQSEVNLLASRFTEAYHHGTVLDLKYVFAALTSDLTTHYVYGTNLKFSRSRISKMTFSRAWTAWIPGSPCYSSSGDNGTMGDQKTLLQAMATADVPEEEKTATRLQMETLNIIAGGTETTARALAVGVFHLAHKPSLLLQLRDELRTVMPFPDSLASCTQLEQLPYSYLAGVVNESLRLAFGFIIRPARVYPNDPLVNEDLVIPFPHPHRHSDQSKCLFRSRHCLGINFALAEIYLAIATVARRFDLVPYQTTVEQLQMKRDLGFTAPEKGPFTVRAKVTGLAD